MANTFLPMLYQDLRGNFCWFWAQVAVFNSCNAEKQIWLLANGANGLVRQQHENGSIQESVLIR